MQAAISPGWEPRPSGVQALTLSIWVGSSLIASSSSCGQTEHVVSEEASGGGGDGGTKEMTCRWIMQG